MRILGFSFAKQQVRSTVLEGIQANPLFVSKDKADYGSGLDPSKISLWLQRNIEETIAKAQPNLICYRLAWSYNSQAQAYSLVYPCAILELVSHRASVPCKGFGYQALTAKRLGFPKGADVQAHCSALIGSHPPYWDAQQINSALAAIAGMS